MISKDIDTNELIKYAKSKYEDAVSFIGLSDQENNRFSWHGNRHIKLYLIFTKDYKGYNDVILFAEQNKDKDEFIIIDCSDKTSSSYEYYHVRSLGSVAKLFEYFSSNDILDTQTINILRNSYAGYSTGDLNLTMIKSVLKHWVEGFTDTEYEKSVNSLSKNPDKFLKISEKDFFADTYHFSEMLKTIKDKQLEDELVECLYAYNREKWYICACGLGAVLEHLLYLTIKNYGKEKQLGKAPAAAKYIQVLHDDCLKESFTSKDFTYLNICFSARNAVDHFRPGLTSKNLCDTILSGINSSFNNYYLNSLAYHISH